MEERVGLGCSANEGGEDDICGGGPCDVPQVANLYSGIIRHGRLVPRSIIVVHPWLCPFSSKSFQHLAKAGEVVVDRRSVLFATHRLQHG